MTDPFSITAGAVGVAGAALQSVKALLQDIQAIRDAPEAIKDLKEDLLAVEVALKPLYAALQGSAFEPLSQDTIAGLRLALSNCKRACDKFQTKLKKWTKHSTGDGIHWWDRVRVGLFAEAEIEVLSEQLSKCKATVTSAVTTATLLTTTHSTKITEEIKERLLTREVELTEAIIETDEQAAEVDMRLQKLSVTDTDQVGEQARDDSAEVVEELKEEHAALRASRKVLEGLLSETHHARTGQRISNVDMSNGGQLLVGLVNTQGKHAQVAQDISNVRATNGGMGIVGVAEGIDVNAFFSNRPARS